jgi:site-specific DNA-methyltransferase (adenine-specific)
MYVTDVWDDIRELTSGYFAGDEALRDRQGNRVHKQQSPVQLLLRILLSSTKPGDLVLDPFAGTGTTLMVSQQLSRKSIGIEIDRQNVSRMEKRLSKVRESDDIIEFLHKYVYTKDIHSIWGLSNTVQTKNSDGLLNDSSPIYYTAIR